MNKIYEYTLQTDKGPISIEVGVSGGGETCVMLKERNRAFHSVEEANTVLLAENKIVPLELSLAQINEREIAELLHKKLCHHDHVEYCGWHYEDWFSPKKGYSVKEEYLGKARNLLGLVTYEIALSVCEVL